jgi:ribonuclease PH
MAPALAVHKLEASGRLKRGVLKDQIAAVSVAYVGSELLLDPCYAEDSAARVDLNVVATAHSALVEVQGTAEGDPVPRSEMDSMIDLALTGIAELCALQRRMLGAAGVAVENLLATRTS